MGMIMVIGIVAKNGILLLDAEHRFRSLGYSAEEAMIQGRPPPLAPYRHDRPSRPLPECSLLPSGLAPVPQCSSLSPFAVVGGILSSMILSLVFTPTINFYLDRLRFGRAKTICGKPEESKSQV